MSCRRSEEIDLDAFAADPAADEWAEFRLHYPGCPECSEVVGEWADVFALLRHSAGAGDAHPAPEQWARFVDAPGALQATERVSMERHLAGCPTCRLEVSVSRGFDLAPAATPAARPDAPSFVDRLRDWASALPELMPAPAFAAAAGIIVTVGAVWLATRTNTDLTAPGDDVHTAEQRAVAPREEEVAGPFDDAGSAKAPSPVTPPFEMADALPTPSEPERAAPEAIGKPEPDAPSPAASSLATAPRRASPLEEAVEAESSSDLPEEVLLAANYPVELPAYTPDIALAGGSFNPYRQTIVVRSVESEATPAVQALAPEHVGASSTATPRLYWVAARRLVHPVKILIVDDAAVDPLLEIDLSPPIQKGLHVLDLAEHRVDLVPGTIYRWWVRLVVDLDEPDRNTDSGAAVRFTPLDAAIDKNVPSEEGAHRAAAAGYWFDAFDQLTRWIESDPGLDLLGAHRQSLLEQVELGDALATSTSQP